MLQNKLLFTDQINRTGLSPAVVFSKLQSHTTPVKDEKLLIERERYV